MEKYLIGWAERDITPNRPVSLNGQFAERISESVEKPITVTAFAVSTEQDQLVLCSTDLVCVSWALTLAVRERLAKVDGLDPMKVILSAIHTHTSMTYAHMEGRIDDIMPWPENAVSKLTGLEYKEFAEITGNTELFTGEEAFAFLVDKITEAVTEAWQNRRPGTLVSAFGRAPVGMCRRAAYIDGTAAMWGNTETPVFEALEGGNDSGIELLYAFDEAGNLTGVVPNLACPAQAVQHRMFVSPDFWGETKLLLRKRFGEKLFMLPLCSAAGDQCPVDIVRWVEPESDVHDPNIKRDHPSPRKADPSMFDLKGMRLAGRRIADEVIRVFEDGLDEAEEVELIHHVRDFELPLRLVGKTQYEQAVKNIKDAFVGRTGTVDFNDEADHLIEVGDIWRYETQHISEVLPTECHVIRLGGIAIATNPFELFLDYGNQIKARSHAKQTFLIQLAVSCEGYLPTEKAENNGHYSAIVGSGYVGHVGGNLLVRETLNEINRNLF